MTIYKQFSGGFSERRAETCRQIALDAGRPANIESTREMFTWRKLRDEIDRMPVEMLSRQVEMWMYSDTDTYEGGHHVYGITPFDADKPIDDDNYMSLDMG